LPYADATFDIVTSVYLFHEAAAQRAPQRRARDARVLRPAACSCSKTGPAHREPDIGAALRSFPGEFHEPFYNDYLEDDLPR